MGADGCVVKSDATSELLPAVRAVLEGKPFVSPRLDGRGLTDRNERPASNHLRRKVGTSLLPNGEPAHHEVGLYSDDRHLLDAVTQFIGAALEAGNAAVVVATESHRNSLLRRLQALGFDIHAAIREDRYIALDAAEALSTFMLNGVFDSARFVELWSNLLDSIPRTVEGRQAHVAVFGECVDLLCALGSAEAAIQDEKLCNELVKRYDVSILCGYSRTSFPTETDSHIFQRICAEHSAVYSR